MLVVTSNIERTMNGIIRKIIGIIMLIAGIGAIALSGYLLFTGKSISLFSLISFFLGGVVVAISGWEVIAGARIHDIFDFLFTGIP